MSQELFIRENLRDMSPHGEALGMELLGERDGKIYVQLPYAEHLVGDPDSGVIHGGVITATLDNISGWSVRIHDQWLKRSSLVTLDMRIDYMRPATPHKDILAMGKCYKITKNIAFVRASAYQEAIDDPIATSVATFMLGIPAAGAK